jgi:hypothetical protein
MDGIQFSWGMGGIQFSRGMDGIKFSWGMDGIQFSWGMDGIQFSYNRSQWVALVNTLYKIRDISEPDCSLSASQEGLCSAYFVG